MGTKDIIELSISGAALVVSLFALYKSTVKELLATQIAKDANKLSDASNKFSEAANATAMKALEFSSFNYKQDILPELRARRLPTVNDFCFFHIENTSHGKAVINKIEAKGVSLQLLVNGTNQFVPIPQSITLLYNGIAFLKAVAEVNVDDNDPNPYQYYTMLFDNLSIEIEYENQEGTNYRTFLTTSVAKAPYFTGIAREFE